MARPTGRTAFKRLVGDTNLGRCLILAATLLASQQWHLPGLSTSVWQKWFYMDTAKHNDRHCTVIIDERNTGIVIAPETLQRWTKESGRNDRIHMDSLEQARQFAHNVVAVRPDLEVMILDFQGEFVEMINGLIADGTDPCS